jgi:hypothetical protein
LCLFNSIHISLHFALIISFNFATETSLTLILWPSNLSISKNILNVSYYRFSLLHNITYANIICVLYII